MPKTKKAQNIVLTKDQFESLLYSSIRNIQELVVDEGEIDNNFIVTMVLSIVSQDMFPQWDHPELGPTDYELSDFYVSHMIDPLEAFGGDLYRLDNRETKEKFWTVTLVVDETDISDFVKALAEIESFWDEIDLAEEVQSQPSEDSVLVPGNDTVN